MSNPVSEKTSSFLASGHPAALVVGRVEAGNLHAGFLYRSADDTEERCLHMAWDNRLDDEFVWLQRIWAVPDVDRAVLVSLAAWCRMLAGSLKARRRDVARRRAAGETIEFDEAKFLRIKYGLIFNQSTFVDRRGKAKRDGTRVDEFGLSLGPDGTGLTCATFLLAMLNAVHLQLVDDSAWPIRTDEDRAWLASLLASLPESIFTPELRASLKAEIDAGARRIRPEEVIGACACSHPADFVQCEPVALSVLAMIDAEAAATAALGAGAVGTTTVGVTSVGTAAANGPPIELPVNEPPS